MDTTLAFLLTVHNRKTHTLSCIENISNQKNEICGVSIFMVDDGSDDGISEIVSKRYPDIVVLKGNGNLYWNGGMRLAFHEAMKIGFDYYLWLNNDTNLYPTALEKLLFFSNKLGPKAIIVGSIKDPINDIHTYGGVFRPNKLRATHYEPILPTLEPIQAETFNGNCVLLPKKVVEIVGNLDQGFTHGMGDLDYGHRACKNGCSVWVAPGYYGTCARNQINGTWQDINLSRQERWKKIQTAKGLPMKEWALYTRRHGGLLWPLYWSAPYLKLLFS